MASTVEISCWNYVRAEDFLWPAACLSLAVRTCFSVKISSSVFFSSAFHSSLCLSCSSALNSWKSRPITESVGELISWNTEISYYQLTDVNTEHKGKYPGKSVCLALAWQHIYCVVNMTQLQTGKNLEDMQNQWVKHSQKCNTNIQLEV